MQGLMVFYYILHQYKAEEENMYEKIFVWMMIIGTACLSVGCGNQNAVETGTGGMGDDSGALYKQKNQGEIQENIEIGWETGRVQGDGDINSTWGSSIEENDQYFFYTAKEGIVRVDKATGAQTCILEWGKKKPRFVILCLGADRLYYVENDKKVYSVDYFGREKTEIMSIKRLEEAQKGEHYLRPLIFGISVQARKLYFATEEGIFVSDENGRYIKYVMDESKTSCFWGECLIYQNDISEVHSFNLVSGENKTILGGNITEEEYQRGNYDRYQQQFVYQDTLYYIKNNKTLYQYVQDGEDVLLAVLPDNQYYMRGLCSSDGKLYYTYCEKNGEKYSGMYIRRYQNGKDSDAVLLPDDCTKAAGVIGKTIFYITESGQAYKIFSISE